ncbi:MAG TPA: hypothetical protein VGH91_12780 [Gammaproteobacteria bacterium]|jgi:hypothetical protein
MTRKAFSALFLIVSLVVGLGAFGHGHQWGSHVSGMLGGVAPDTVKLLELIWFWVSGTMLVFGILLLWCWLHLRRGEVSLMPIPWITGGFYIIAGTCGALWVAPFFWLFPVLGALLWLCTWMLRTKT